MQLLKKIGLKYLKIQDEVNNSVYGTLTWLLFTVCAIFSGRSEWWPDHSSPHSRHVRVSGTLPQRPGTPQPGVLQIHMYL